jgi:hypothetical protein
MHNPRVQGWTDPLAISVQSSYLVMKTAHGEGNSRRVLRRFLELGIDPALLDLPEDMQAETKNTGAVA